MLKLNRFNFSQQYLDYGYKELTIPAGPTASICWRQMLFTSGPRGNHMLIALPNIDGTFACILFLPFEGADSFASLSTEKDVIRFFEQRFPDALRLMPQLAENYATNPTGVMVTIKCSPWNVEGRALLVGDAAHAIVPFFGQGINCGFEDCTYLVELLDRHGANWTGVFTEFGESARSIQMLLPIWQSKILPKCEIGLRTHTFCFERKWNWRWKQSIPSSSSEVCHGDLSSHTLLCRTGSRAVQDRMLSELCNGVDRVEDLDWEQADRLIHRDLTPLEMRP